MTKERDDMLFREEVRQMIGEVGVAHLFDQIAIAIQEKREELQKFTGDRGQFVDSLGQLHMAMKNAEFSAGINRSMRDYLTENWIYEPTRP